MSATWDFCVTLFYYIATWHCCRRLNVVLSKEVKDQILYISVNILAVLYRTLIKWLKFIYTFDILFRVHMISNKLSELCGWNIAILYFIKIWLSIIRMFSSIMLNRNTSKPKINFENEIGLHKIFNMHNHSTHWTKVN